MRRWINYLLTTIGGVGIAASVIGCMTLYGKLRERDATIDQWSVGYARMVQEKNEEIERLKWQRRISPPTKNENPRLKGRG